MATTEATREILWNVNSATTPVVMYTMMVFSLIIAGIGLYRHFEIVAAGQSDSSPQPSFPQKLYGLFRDVIFQRKVIREKGIGIAHTLIYVGFLVLLFATTMVFIEHDLGIKIYHGDFYLAVTILSDLFGFGVLIGCMLASRRRYILKADRVHNRRADSWMLEILCLLIVQGFVLEALRIHVTQDPWAPYSPIGWVLSKLFWGLSLTSASVLHAIVWWFHTITVFVVIALLPYTKFLHILASSANLYFGFRVRPKGALPSPGDIEELIEKGEEFTLGLGTIQDYSWKHLLDLEACTSCGRCQSVCPAYLSGKPLSPKWLILDTRNHLLSLHADGKMGDSKLSGSTLAFDSHLLKTMLLKRSGLVNGEDGYSYEDNGEFRAGNTEVQNSALEIGKDPEQRIASGVMKADTFWSCNTCMACVEACPVGINHVEQIVENRRNMVLMEGEIPTEAQGTLRALETRSNPYGAPEDRINWLTELDVKILEPGDEVDYLYWVGCVSAYDPRKQKIAQSLVKLMNAAGLSFGILGTSEGCSGDPARRLGEENLFQALAKSNIETLRQIKFKTLVANCPHCFNTIKNEYPQLGMLSEGEEVEIIHHSVLLKKLLKEGKLSVEESAEAVTLHDPCYLGRYNDEYDAPRSTLKSRKGLKILEMDRSKEKGLCCGAGGGHFWMDMKVGERVNSIRVDEAAATGAAKIATACPFCMQMLEDGIKLTEREESMEVKDIAEFLAEGLVDPDSNS